MKVKCDWCGEEFEKPPYMIKRSRHNFCSMGCKGKWRSKNLRGENNFNWKGGRVIVKCDHCGKGFLVAQCLARRNNYHFCSRKCRGKWLSWRLKGERSPCWKGGEVEVECEYCGRKIHIKRAKLEYYKKHFCSNGCQGRWRSENLRGEKNYTWMGGKIKVKCDFCGKEITRDRNEIEGHKNHFCSERCYGKWVSMTRSGENSPLWKGGCMRNYGPNWHIQKRIARERDKYACRVCGTREDGRALDVHHIDPFKGFGLENYKEANQILNLITLCRPCHKKADHGEIPIDVLKGMVT